MRRSLVLRYTLIYTALFALVVAGALGFLYWTAVRAHRASVDAAIDADAEHLRRSLTVMSTSERVAFISRTAQEHGETIVALASERLEVVAGNLHAWPAGARGDGHLEFPLDPGALLGMPAGLARARALALPSGQQLLVGQSLAPHEEIKQWIGRTLLGALLLTTLLGFAGSYAIARAVARRLENVNRASDAILAGDLTRRIPVGQSGDEFDTLAQNLNRMLDRIESLVEAMREVTDDVAHDLKGPISRLRSRIEVTLLGPDDPATHREALERTVRDLDGVLRMFGAILDIAVAESGTPRERFVSVDLSHLVREVVEDYEGPAEQAKLELTAHVEDGLRITGEPNLITQALTNLLDNALKYVPAGGHVRVEVTRSGARARLIVADDGPGIPDEFRARAFERFSRLERSRTSPGSGLGLALVSAVTTLHGGKATLEARSPGLAVILDLPLAPD